MAKSKSGRNRPKELWPLKLLRRVRAEGSKFGRNGSKELRTLKLLGRVRAEGSKASEDMERLLGINGWEDLGNFDRVGMAVGVAHPEGDGGAEGDKRVQGLGWFGLAGEVEGLVGVPYHGGGRRK